MEQSIISAEYLSAVKAIKQAILESRYRAARHVNKEMLTLYYWVGHYVSVHSRVDAWKTNAIGVISKMLQQELPGLTGFSETNIKNMRIFYEAWSPVLNRQMSSADWDNVLDVKLLLNRQLTAADLNEDDFELFLCVGFTHHREIIRQYNWGLTPFVRNAVKSRAFPCVQFVFLLHLHLKHFNQTTAL